MEETDRLFACKFCEVKSYLIEQGHFQYQLPLKAADKEDLFYFPYWRFKGTLFSVSPMGIENRFADISHQAVTFDRLPISLGLRSQALKLKFVTPESEGIFLTPVHGPEKIMAILNERFQAGFPKPSLHQEYIGENLSLIYAPFYIKKDKIIDGVLNQPLTVSPGSDFSLENYKAGPASGRLKFLPALCPQCGWDLGGERDSLALLCRNCDSAWLPDNGRLEKSEIAYLPTQSSNARYLPFWVVEADVAGVPLKSYGDFIRIANLPKVVQPQWEHKPFRFWGPAFKVRPQKYLSLVGSMTVSQPTQELASGIPQNHELISVNLPLQEGLETLKLNLANLIRPRRLMIDSIHNIRIEPRSHCLVYLPFEDGPHELIQPNLNLAINKNQLNLSKNL